MSRGLNPLPIGVFTLGERFARYLNELFGLNPLPIGVFTLGKAGVADATIAVS